MSTPQTDAHHALQQNIYENFTELVTTDFDMAGQWLLDNQHDEMIDNNTLVRCENYLDEEKTKFEEQSIEDYKNLLNMHV